MLPAAPPIPKAPGTLLPAFDLLSAAPVDAVNETPCNQQSDSAPERLELVFVLFFSITVAYFFVFLYCLCGILLCYI